MFGGRAKGKRDERHQRVAKARKPTHDTRGATQDARSSVPNLTRLDFTIQQWQPQHQVQLYKIPDAAATTANISRQPYSVPALPYPTLQPERGLNKDLIAQGSKLYNASVGAANEALAASEDVIYELLCSRLDSVITAIDGETFSGDERELGRYTAEDERSHNSSIVVIHEGPQLALRGGGLFGKNHSASRGADRAISSTLTSTNYFAKATLYANSKLPVNLPPLRLLLPAYSLLCLAAQYSTRAYTKASGSERDAFINADWRLGTKAMVIKSVPIDDMDCVVFAIRGSQTFMDWAVNLHSAPESPLNFLDDPGNLCHSGFLSVARKMLKTVAERLRQLLEENPARSTCSLLMTGHSAGGAVASLLYAHMLAERVQSELNTLTGFFKRIHCITFGAPPISLLPLTKPPGQRHKKSLFLSVINEGDPVPRADPAYVRSLLRLYASPSPSNAVARAVPKPNLRIKPKKAMSAPQVFTSKDYVWEVPPGTLSNAGRLVVLRGHAGQDAPTAAEEDVKAQVTCDQDLRSVVFGDPVMHMMKIYTRRIEVLATKAITGGLTH